MDELKAVVWWSELPAVVKYGLALGFIALSTVLYFAFKTVWMWGWLVGAVLLMLSGPSDRERRGYH